MSFPSLKQMLPVPLLQYPQDDVNMGFVLFLFLLVFHREYEDACSEALISTKVTLHAHRGTHEGGRRRQEELTQ